MRIIAGEFRGIALAAVGKGDTGAHLRPTTDRVRESLFNVLLGGRFEDPIANARVLDLFAGTGALGLEALSRGAAEVCFVDQGRKALGLIRKNIAITKCQARSKIVAQDATRLPSHQLAPFDLVFLDPPYGKGLGAKALECALRQRWIAQGALVVLEENAPQAPPAGFSLLDQRKYGDSHMTFMQVG